MSYIEKEKALRLLKGECVARYPASFSFGLFAAADEISKMPTADVVEVKHGEWKYYECVSSYDGTISGYACSVCNAFVDDEYFETEEFHKKFCGNCGAKMDRVRSENEEIRQTSP